uniref:glucan 1,3-beta-glucosidase n=1 Tax=Albugo laibachii Nc14 TaxID=890382 RepID=F0WQ83_9STRA|nr:unnamed protein product [Albugo laibachii Nc14]|eukprot:CCA23489.1 unnamed protein product [Albugo laibachii Nc14]
MKSIILITAILAQSTAMYPPSPSPYNGGWNYPQGNRHVQWDIREGRVRSKGVNLGGWLVLESWMTQSSNVWKNVDETIQKQGEYATMKFLGHEVGDRLFSEHRETWITEQDIIDIASAGMNLVRVSTGYWITEHLVPVAPNFQEDISVHAPGGLFYLDRLIFDWATRHNVAVIISLHGHAGSQNGQDHSGAKLHHKPQWSEDVNAQKASLDWAKFIADRYRSSESFLGITLMNEPEHPTKVEDVKKYYTEAYNEIRATGNNCVLILCPMLTEQDNNHGWQNFMNTNTINVWFEWHPYFKWGYENNNMEQVLEAVKRRSNDIAAWTGSCLFIGEWSMDSSDSANFGANPDTLVNFGRAQKEALRPAHCGTSFWSWKASDPTTLNLGWSMNVLLQGNLLDMRDA